MRKRQDIYDGKHRYDDELRRLREADISPLNRETIKRFNDDRFAQQLKASTVIKRSAQLRRIAELLGKDFIEVEREDILRLLRIISTAKLKKSAAAYAHPGKVDPNPKELSVAGKKDYWRIIKCFFRWLDMEEVLKDVNPNFRERIEIGPIITEEHLKKAVAATTSVRDKALLWVMHESGARIGELLNVLIRDVTREEYGLRVRGLTARPESASCS